MHMLEIEVRDLDMVYKSLPFGTAAGSLHVCRRLLMMTIAFDITLSEIM